MKFSILIIVLIATAISGQATTPATVTQAPTAKAVPTAA